MPRYLSKIVCASILCLSIVGCNTVDTPMFANCNNLTIGEVISRIGERYCISDTNFMGEYPTYDALSLYENKKCVAEICFDRIWASDSAKRSAMHACVREIRLYDPGSCFTYKDLRAAYYCECSNESLRTHLVDTAKSK
jgi:hypothetical protein